MTDHDHVRSQLLDLPAAAPDDQVFSGIVAAGRGRRTRRRASLLAAGCAVVVAAATTIALTLPGAADHAPTKPATTGGARDCRQDDVSARLGAGAIQTARERLDQFPAILTVHRACVL